MTVYQDPKTIGTVAVSGIVTERKDEWIRYVGPVLDDEVQ